MSRLSRRAGWVVLASELLWSAAALAQDAAAGGQLSEDAAVRRAIGLGAAAAFATAVSILGAGYAVGRVGSAAMGAVAEKPELMARGMLFVALAEGLAVLGFAMAILLVQKI